MKRLPLTTVSLRGDASLVRELKLLAIRDGTTVGDLVRNALRLAYGNKLTAFDAQDDAYTHHNTAEPHATPEAM